MISNLGTIFVAPIWVGVVVSVYGVPAILSQQAAWNPFLDGPSYRPSGALSGCTLLCSPMSEVELYEAE